MSPSVIASQKKTFPSDSIILCTAKRLYASDEFRAYLDVPTCTSESFARQVHPILRSDKRYADVYAKLKTLGGENVRLSALRSVYKEMVQYRQLTN